MEKYVMVSNEFGYEIFIAPLKNLDIQVTDKQEEAEIWDERDVKTELKLLAHRLITGLDLQWKKIS